MSSCAIPSQSELSRLSVRAGESWKEQDIILFYGPVFARLLIYNAPMRNQGLRIPVVGELAPDLSLQGLNGDMLKLDDLTAPLSIVFMRHLA